LELDGCILLDCEAAGRYAQVPCLLLGQDHAARSLSGLLLLLLLLLLPLLLLLLAALLLG